MKIRQIQQISEHHCGPAVLQMLLDALDYNFSQQEITTAGGVEDTIEEHGVRVDQLARACSVLAPNTQFWYKYGSSINDIRYILNRGFVVGVEWQGLFYQDEDDEEEDGDYGHYSIISHLDDEEELLVIVDPYKEFAHQDRIFSVDSFLHRWWDENEVIDQFSHRPHLVKDDRLLFFVTPAGEFFDKELGFKLYQGAQT